MNSILPPVVKTTDIIRICNDMDVYCSKCSQESCNREICMSGDVGAGKELLAEFNLPVQWVKDYGWRPKYQKVSITIGD